MAGEYIFINPYIQFQVYLKLDYGATYYKHRFSSASSLSFGFFGSSLHETFLLEITPWKVAPSRPAFHELPEVFKMSEIRFTFPDPAPKNTLIRLVARFFHLSGPAATPGSEPPGGTLGKDAPIMARVPWTGCWHRQETPSCSSADGPDPVRRKRWKIVRPRWEWQNVYKSRKIEVCGRISTSMSRTTDREIGERPLSVTPPYRMRGCERGKQEI